MTENLVITPKHHCLKPADEIIHKPHWWKLADERILIGGNQLMNCTSLEVG